MQSFQIDVLFAFETAENGSALTIEKAKVSQIQSNPGFGLFSDIATDFFSCSIISDCFPTRMPSAPGERHHVHPVYPIILFHIVDHYLLCSAVDAVYRSTKPEIIVHV